MAAPTCALPEMNSEEYGIMRSLEDTYWWYVALRKEVSERVAGWTPQQGILDAGCGSGGMLARLREDFPAAVLTGLDSSPIAVRQTRERGIADTVVEGSVNAMPWPDRSFDVVISLDVLVHAMVDESAALHEFRRVLRPGGMLLLNLAAFDCFAGSHDLAVHGVRRYTVEKVGRLAAQAGFRIVSSTYWNFLLSPFILARRLASRHSGRTDSDLKPLPLAVNAALRSLTSFELWIGRSVPLPFGSSLLIVLKADN
jgi:SAM-dependent methyltransferase